MAVLYNGLQRIAPVVMSGSQIITATNSTGSAISAGDKVFITLNGVDYNIITPKISTNAMYGFIGGGSTDADFITVDLNNKSVSSFSTTKNCLVKKVIDYTQPWEFNICFRMGIDISGERYIWFGNSSTYADSGLKVYYYDNKIYIDMHYSNNGTQTRLTDFYSYTITQNTTYYIKIGWTGTQYYVKYSTDGENWTEDSNSPYSSQTPLNQACTGIIIGNRPGWNNNFFPGTIFMDKTYMTSGDTIQWQMYSDGSSNLKSDILTGIAKENIAINATGKVSIAG